MILATTETIAGREAADCPGIIVAEALATPTTAQLFAMSSRKMSQVRLDLMFDAREKALDSLANFAPAREADPVVAIRIDCEIVEMSMGRLPATAAGTAVRLAPKEGAK